MKNSKCKIKKPEPARMMCGCGEQMYRAGQVWQCPNENCRDFKRIPSGRSILEVRQPFAGQSVGIGNLTVVRNLRGRLWIDNAGGDGMQLSAEKERDLAVLLEGWFNKNF